MIKNPLSEDLKQKTIASHLPFGSRPSIRYFHSPERMSCSGELKIVPDLRTAVTSCMSSCSFASSSRKCLPRMTAPLSKQDLIKSVASCLLKHWSNNVVIMTTLKLLCQQLLPSTLRLCVCDEPSAGLATRGCAFLVLLTPSFAGCHGDGFTVWFYQPGLCEPLPRDRSSPASEATSSDSYFLFMGDSDLSIVLCLHLHSTMCQARTICTRRTRSQRVLTTPFIRGNAELGLGRR